MAPLETMQTDNEKLQAYAVEMELAGDKSLSLDQLIDSHRTLRAFRQLSEAERREQITAAREFAAKQATEEVKSLGWFSVERLRGMTMAELAELIRED
jgi:hypoxanthine phosphoribosyltransferase